MVAAAFVIHTIRGIGIASMDVATNTLIQRLVPRAMLGRVFGNLYGAIGAAAGLSYVLGGLLLDLTYRDRPSSSPAREVCSPPSPLPWHFGTP